ncbi:MAG: glycosyltransferase family 1 protein [Phycisphaerae bacterium]|nr:glycosyltransferase family 1 protein [Phycisphaerae bacterium]
MHHAPHVILFTDTLADVNGVSRFIRTCAARSRATGRALTVVTSARLPIDREPNIRNIPPFFSTPMPGYPGMRLACPRPARMLAPPPGPPPTAVHASTPGPVGLLGMAAARRWRVPLVATYHTDFPAYVSRLFGDDVLADVCRAAMRAFYTRCDRVLLRSPAYRHVLRALGVPDPALIELTPGIDTTLFDPARRDEAIWDRVAPASPPGPRVLYVGRISVEKNLARLADAWPAARARCAARGVCPGLFVVGDGPFRAELQRRLRGHGAHVLGFRHGPELASLYASSDLFVFPSRTDTLGQAVMEAQASGLPAIVSAAGGPARIVAEGVTGVVVTRDSDAAWADAIASLVRDEPRRRSMGRAAHARSRAWSFDRSFEHFMDAHENLPAPA